jgi:hypothetical protein
MILYLAVRTRLDLLTCHYRQFSPSFPGLPRFLLLLKSFTPRPNRDPSVLSKTGTLICSEGF